MIVVLCSVVASLAAPSLAQGSGGSMLTSPCPRVFRYAPLGIEPGLWAGVATLSTDILLNATWLNIVLDRPALGFGQLWHLVGDTTTQDNIDFVIYNFDLQIHPNHPVVVRFYVQYDPLNTTPRLREMKLNGKVICDADTNWRATVDRPVLSNVRQPSSSSSDPKIRTDLNMKPLKSTQSEDDPVYRRNENTFSIAVINPNKSYLNTSESSETVECGVVSGDNEGITLFYRGLNYTRGDIPWLVAIHTKKKNALTFICGGTLVSDRHVVTAASCMLRRAAQTAIKDIVVKVGAYNLIDWSDDFAFFRGLLAISIHEDYNPSTLENNILILTLDKRVKFNNYIRPACLWSGDIKLSRVVGATGVVAGWGVKSEEGTGEHNEPHKVLVPIVSTSHCRASKPAFYNLTSDKTFCAGARNGVSPCVGDSGAGLYLQENGRWRLRGVVSLYLRSDDESSECNLNEYVVYTDTAQYLTWIRNVLSVQYIN